MYVGSQYEVAGSTSNDEERSFLRVATDGNFTDKPSALYGMGNFGRLESPDLAGGNDL